MKSLAVLLFFAVLAPAQDEALPSQRAGKYEVGLRLPPGGLYPGEEMQIEFRVTDTSQVDPLLGATPVVRAKTHSVIFMPAMPGMAKLEETAHLEGVPGEYGVHPTFAHGGEFRLELTIQPPAAPSFQVAFPLQVADSAPKNHKAPPRAYSVELKSNPKSPKAGEPVDLQFTFHHRDSPKEIFRTFEIQHERPLHLLIIRADLGTFSHEHPDQQPDGSFRTRFIFPDGGEYHLFADVAPRGAGSQILMMKLKVSGKPGVKYDVTTAAPDGSVEATGLAITLDTNPASLPAKKTTHIRFLVRDEATKVAVTDLQPYLGAKGHLLLLHEDGVSLVHSHPDESVDRSDVNGVVPFLARFPKEGNYRGWVQFQRGGKVITGKFVVHAGLLSGESGAR